MVELMPFYLWRVEGRWNFLPNPLAVETWYQRVPDELEPGYEQLTNWYQQQAQQRQDLFAADATQLITAWRLDMNQLFDQHANANEPNCVLIHKAILRYPK